MVNLYKAGKAKLSIMTQALTAEKRYSLEEYFRVGESASEKYEFYQGKLIKVPGGTFEHNLIATRISTQLENALGDLETPYTSSSARINR